MEYTTILFTSRLWFVYVCTSSFNVSCTFLPYFSSFRVFSFSLSTIIQMVITAIGRMIICALYNQHFYLLDTSAAVADYIKAKPGSCEYVISFHLDWSLHSHTLMIQPPFDSDWVLWCVLWMNFFVLFLFYFRVDIHLYVIECDQGQSVTTLTFPSFKYHLCIIYYM